MHRGWRDFAAKNRQVNQAIQARNHGLQRIIGVAKGDKPGSKLKALRSFLSLDFTLRVQRAP